MTTHTVTFQRNTRSGHWRAICSCGWFHIGTQTEVHERAAGHDVEWVDEPESPPAVPHGE